ncbi:hypothetical protein [Mesobacillus jeotgali]|mgnify:CR=1 FL=1|jgi:hypothetical protein|uniref:hypothetical protein n=1 Tax=Mesobacillus jeotgali TaxID=129985 RepID=UPI001785A070|nr:MULTISPECIES: hypothetical protein [Mesobacillus]MCM3575755.1 hypothetical protein [Mesobacillus subterraneus]UYZ24180.1 hypothetical protein FOF60_11855 [Mesobacillus jeotgali]
MFVVHFYDHKNEVLNQLLQRVPEVGENLKLKGRKGKVESVLAVDEKTYHVQVTLEAKAKPGVTADPGKKKKK